MSSQGLYFFVNSAEGLSIGQDLELLVKLPPEITLSSYCLIRCEGRVVRIEDNLNNMIGIAVEFLEGSSLAQTRTGT
jgi:hypothetical protein